MPFTRLFASALLAVLAGRHSAVAQRFIHNPPGLDTTFHESPVCDTLPVVQHFNAKTKYPVGSEVLAARANAWLQKEAAVDAAVTGLVSFRFRVDCEGKPSGFYCEQSNLRWQPVHFPDAVVTSLYRFVLSLAPMPAGRVKYERTQEATAVNYFTYFSFLLQYGKVQSVAP